MTIRSENAMANLIARVKELEERLRRLECVVEGQGEDGDDDCDEDSGMPVIPTDPTHIAFAQDPIGFVQRRGSGRPRKVRY